MKTKLLKQIRKRFTITHYPKGIRLNDNGFYPNNLFVLKDNDNDNDYWQDCAELSPVTEKIPFTNLTGNTPKECIDKLLDKMLEEVKKEHPSLGSKTHKRIPTKKVWYNP